jgi:hypothetical protein
MKRSTSFILALTLAVGIFACTTKDRNAEQLTSPTDQTGIAPMDQAAPGEPGVAASPSPTNRLDTQDTAGAETDTRPEDTNR